MRCLIGAQSGKAVTAESSYQQHCQAEEVEEGVIDWQQDYVLAYLNKDQNRL